MSAITTPLFSAQEPSVVSQSRGQNGKVLEVGANGHCQPMAAPSESLRLFPAQRPYRLCQLLCDLEVLGAAKIEDCDRIRIAATLVQRFLAQAAWLVAACPTPQTDERLRVHSLYREPGYPITVKTVAWRPGIQSPVHNHAAWSIVAILGDATTGSEKNHFWCRHDDGSRPNYAEVTRVSQQILQPGDILGLMPDAIHSVETIAAPASQRPTYTFNVYGKADLQHRYMYDPPNCRLKHC